MDLTYSVKKNRFKFSKEDEVAYLYDINSVEQRRSELKIFTKQLKIFKIDIKKLCNQKPKLEVRNSLLNIAFYIIENPKLLASITKLKGLPLKRLSKITGKSTSFLERWHNYLLAYILIFSNDKYSEIKKCMWIYENSDKDIIDYENNDNSSDVKEEDEDIKNASASGMAIYKIANFTCLLTPAGSFIGIKSDEKPDVGMFCTGKRIRFFIHKNEFTIVGVIVLIIVTVFAFKFLNRPYTNVIVKCPEGFNIHIKLNMFNRVSSASSFNSPRGKFILDNVKVSNASLDDALSRIFDTALTIHYPNDPEHIMPESANISIFISLKKANVDLPKTLDIVKQNGLTLDINNNGDLQE